MLEFVLGLARDVIRCIRDMLKQMREWVARLLFLIERAFRFSHSKVTDEGEESYRAWKYRKKRKQLLDVPEWRRDKNFLEKLINVSLQEAHARGDEYDLIVLTEKQFRLFDDVPISATIKEWRQSKTHRDIPPRLQSIGHDRTVYVTYSDSVDGPILINGSVFD